MLRRLFERFRRRLFWALAERAVRVGDGARELRGVRPGLIVLVLGESYKYLDHAGFLMLLSGPAWDVAVVDGATTFSAPTEVEKILYIYVVDSLQEMNELEGALSIAPSARHVCDRPILVTPDMQDRYYFSTNWACGTEAPEVVLYTRARPRMHNLLTETCRGSSDTDTRTT